MTLRASNKGGDPAVDMLGLALEINPFFQIELWPDLTGSCGS